MPKAIRILSPVLLLAAVYCGWIPVDIVRPECGDLAELLWVVMPPLAGLMNVVSAYTDRGVGSLRRLTFWGMLLKLCLIPFYLLLFFGGFTILVALAVVPGLIFAVPIAMAMFIVMGYALQLLTSSYGFVAAARAREQGLVGGGTATFLIMLHAVPVADVVAAILLFGMVRETDGEQAPKAAAA